MNADTLLAILLVWSVAGLLAAIAFGKAIRETSPDEEQKLAASTGTVKYFRRNTDKQRSETRSSNPSRHRSAKHAS